MNPRILYWLLFLLSVIPISAAPKNVVLFVADDHGRDAGCYGNPIIKTPNLDRLAAGGTRFDFAFCTTASCSPSRSVILSGLHNHATGQFGLQHSYHHFHAFSAVRSLPVRLAEAGYRTASIGKFHVQPESVFHFQTYLEGNQGGTRNAVSMAIKCREFISASDERPFFLYFCTGDPHRGGGAATNRPGRPNLFGNGPKYEGVKEAVYDPDEVIVPPFLPASLECRAELAQYYQSVSRVDQGLGKLVEILEETGQFENTLIIYTSDNGIPFPGAKTTLYEPGTRLPLIVRNPDQKRRGVVSKALVSWVDLTPTILDFAGVMTNQSLSADLEVKDTRPARSRRPGPTPFHGRSFLSILEKENPTGWDEIYCSHTFHEVTMYYPMRAIRTRQYKYIFNLAHPLPFPFASDLYGSSTWQSTLQRGDAKYGRRRVADYVNRPRHELYDLESDPHEVVNLAGKPEVQELLGELQAKLRRFQEQTKDPWSIKYEHE